GRRNQLRRCSRRRRRELPRGRADRGHSAHGQWHRQGVPVPADTLRRPEPASHGLRRDWTRRQPVRTARAVIGIDDRTHTARARPGRFGRKMRPLRVVEVLRMAVLCAATLCVMVPAGASPFEPTDDALLLERLREKTDPAARELKRLRATLAQRPGDVTIATRFARRAIETAREAGDPRYLGQAQAALAPWWNLSDPSPTALLLRATVKQSMHDFSGALADLDRLLAARPGDAQALLTRATVLTAPGRYA